MKTNMQNLVSRATANVRSLNHGSMNVAAFILAILMIATTVEVLMRYVFGSPIRGVNQLAEYALVWLCFLGVGWVLTNDAHIAITIMDETFYSKKKSRVRTFSFIKNLVCLCYCLILLWFTSKSVWLEYVDGGAFSGELKSVPKYLPYLCIPFGFLTLTLQLIINLVNDVLGTEVQKIDSDAAASSVQISPKV